MQLFDQMFFSVVTFLIVNMGYMIIKRFAPGAPILLVVLLIWILYYRKVVKQYSRPMTLISIHAAADLDRADTVRASALWPACRARSNP
jgi:hypothetical protein